MVSKCLKLLPTKPKKSLTVDAFKEAEQRNRKAAKLLKKKKRERKEQIAREVAEGKRKPVGRPKKQLTPEEQAKLNAPKRPRGRPKKERTPEEIAEMERIAAERKARGRGRPRKTPPPTPEEVAAKEARAKRRREAIERNKKKNALKKIEEATPLELSPKKGKKTIGKQVVSFNVAANGKDTGGKAVTLKEKKVQNALVALSTFQEEFRDIKKMFGSDAEDFQNDKSTIAMLRSMLAMSIDMIPVAEKAYRDKPNNFNMAALVNLTNQARELANDIRNLQSLEQQIEHINREILQPGVRQMAQDLVTQIYTLKKELSFYIKKPSARRILMAHVDEMARTHAKYMGLMTNEMSEKVRKYLME